MFETAIDDVSRFARPFHFALRKTDAQSASPSAATLFFVNDQGDAVTCKHVGEVLRASDTIAPRYQAFKAAVAALTGNAKAGRQGKIHLAKLHEFQDGTATCPARFPLI